MPIVINGTGTLSGLSAESITPATIGNGAVIQVVSTSKDDTFTSDSTSFVDVTGMSVAITPTTNTNKILVLLQYNFSVASGGYAETRLVRTISSSDTILNKGASAGNRTPGLAYHYTYDSTNTRSYEVSQEHSHYLDNPTTTSAITYKLQLMSHNNNDAYINRGAQDADADHVVRAASNITVIEVVA